MPIRRETQERTTLVTNREPEGVVPAGSKGTAGDKAVMDAVLIVALAWAVLFFLVFSLRRFNV